MAAFNMAIKAVRTKDEDDNMNFNDVTSIFIKKCNVGDSIEGTFAVNYLINRIDEFGL